MAYRVQVEECLVVLPLRGHSPDGRCISIFCQVKMREGGDNWSTYVRKRERGFRKATIGEVTAE